MKKFFEEFKAFAMRGNVLDMAVGVVIGGAFGKITTSLVNDIIMPIISLITGVRVLRDPTRGGVATTLNEFVEGSGLCIELDEDALPVDGPVRTACDMLGLDPLYCANEGKLLAVVSPEQAPAALAALRACEGGQQAAFIGRVSQAYPGKVVLHTFLGGARVLSKLTGGQLPRIC